MTHVLLSYELSKGEVISLFEFKRCYTVAHRLWTDQKKYIVKKSTQVSKASLYIRPHNEASTSTFPRLSSKLWTLQTGNQKRFICMLSNDHQSPTMCGFDLGGFVWLKDCNEKCYPPPSYGLWSCPSPKVNSGAANDFSSIFEKCENITDFLKWSNKWPVANEKLNRNVKACYGKPIIKKFLGLLL